jgi:hypothetical protein
LPVQTQETCTPAVPESADKEAPVAVKPFESRINRDSREPLVGCADSSERIVPPLPYS